MQKNQPLTERVASYRDEMVKTLVDMLKIPAISPVSGGTGEGKRAEFLRTILESWGFKPTTYSYLDESNTERPNIVVRYGDKERTLWVVSHIDTVSEGDIALWNTDPFKPVVLDGRIYGRGSVDDGQPAVASMYALRALKEEGIEMNFNFGLVLVADEEPGSKYGIQKLLRERIFSKTDLFIVPDWTAPNGDQIEVAEKSILWVKITVHGKQVHASTPEDGVNAYRYMAKFLLAADDLLHKKYNAQNQMFAPPVSTFEMTKHEKNVDSVNIISGTEISYIDCRVLPDYKLDDVLQDLRSIASLLEFGEVRIDFEIPNREDAAQPTSENSEIVQLLRVRIKEERGIDAKAIGIGGGTCAGFFRREGFESAVWSTGDDIAHQPNEYSTIKNMVDDAKIFALLFV